MLVEVEMDKGRKYPVRKSAYFSDATAKALDKLSWKERRPVTEIIRELVEAGLAK